MIFSPKSIAIAFLLVLSGFSTAHAAVPAGKQVLAAIKLQGGSGSSADWPVPSTAAYKVHVFVPKTGTTTNALYRVYPKGKRAGSTECLGTDAEFPCHEVTINQTVHPNAWTQLMLNDDPATQWDFVKGKGFVTAVASNLSAAELLNLSSLVGFDNQTIPISIARAAVGKQVTAAIKLQGGSGSSANWPAPSTAAYKVHVFTPKNGTVTNALYRVYPKGKRAGSIACRSSDAKYPCYKAIIDQTAYQNTWTQLTLNNDPETQWEFVKGRGYVTAVASNLSTAELLNLSALVRFQNPSIAIGKTYQGGLIFYVDDTGEHGLVAAPIDQSTGIQWYNGTYLDTGATATARGTGAANTTKIINAQGAGAYAAKLAADLVLNGYDDWFLPSKDELKLMYDNIGQGAPAPLTNIGGFASYNYWSSSEYVYYGAWTQSFVNGGQRGYLKDNTFYVRVVRVF